MKNPEIILKLNKICKHAVTDQYMTQQICNKAILGNGGR